MERNLRNDVLASVVVFLVALPLSLGIALASGAPIMAGIIAAAVGGIVVGLMGGAPLQVSGPAAGLTVIVYGVVQQFGWPTACLVTAIAGAIQIALGLSGIARMALALSPAVVHGMLAGIGVTIAVAQFQVVLGSSPQSGVIKNLIAMPGHLSATNVMAVMLGALALGILILWPKLPKAIRSIPGPLVAVAVPTIISVMIPMKVTRIDLPANLTDGLRLPGLPASNLWVAVIMSAVMIALVASVESLLSAVATDKMHKGARANLDRELVGQGAANTLSGLIGGLPVTGVIVRSTANIASGATTRLSAILHGVWIVVFAALLGSVLESIPLAALAGLLVHVGVKLVNVKDIKELRHHGELPVYLVTLFGVVCIDLVVGVGLGLAVSLFMVLRRMATTEIKVQKVEATNHLIVNGSLTFLNVPKLMETLSAVPPKEKVVVEIHTDFMDHAAFEAVHAWEHSYRSSGGEVEIVETYEPWYARRKDEQPKIAKTPVFRTEPLFVGKGGE